MTSIEVGSYVDTELSEVMRLVPGWRVARPYQAPLTWIIEKVALAADEWPSQDLQLHVSADLERFILTYGNDDVGSGNLAQEFQLARVISRSSLDRWPLRECVRFALQNCKPNQWGYT